MMSNSSVTDASVKVELVAWANTFVGGDGSSRKVFEEPIVEGATVFSVLKGLSTRYKALDDALWDRGSSELAEHIEIVVNDALLGIEHNLNSKVKNGDLIMLMGQYLGG
ncbi:MAG: MoaD/ThiS family protein [Nitrospinota bacterium]|nr:MoaD/ThiS family protein [Nitrospinota bacterium]